MTSRDFCYWLQGKLEIDGEPMALSKEQVTIIQKHLNLVFKHEIDPSYGSDAHLEELNKIHAGIDEAKTKAEQALKAANRPPRDPLIRC